MAENRKSLHQLRPWQADTPQTRRIASLAERRRKLVEERKRLALRLGSTLKLYFPLMLTLFGKSFASEFALDLLRRWPSLSELKRSHPKTLRDFFAQHGTRNVQRQTNWILADQSAEIMLFDLE